MSYPSHWCYVSYTSHWLMGVIGSIFHSCYISYPSQWFLEIIDSIFHSCYMSCSSPWLVEPIGSFFLSCYMSYTSQLLVEPIGSILPMLHVLPIVMFVGTHMFNFFTRVTCPAITMGYGIWRVFVTRICVRNITL